MKRSIYLLCMLTLILSTQAMAQELVLYFPFEGSGDNVTDESGSGNDGKFDPSLRSRAGLGKPIALTVKINPLVRR